MHGHEIIGMTFNRLTAVEVVGMRVRTPLIRCKCVCGKEKTVARNNLKNGAVKSCGCAHTDSNKAKGATGPRVDLTGSRFGLLTVISLDHMEKLHGYFWKCDCDCGSSVVVRTDALKSGKTKGCGCLSGGKITHGHSRGHLQSPTYVSWAKMIYRCTNPKARKWHLYGGRGISVCDRWRNSFEAFLADMGERPAGKTQDRIDGNGNYEPGNCRWATAKEQRANIRSAKP